MRKKYKIMVCLVGILLFLSLMISASYAYYIFGVSQTGKNIVNGDCFEITFTESNAINLTSAIPLTEAEASELTPFTFTIENVCNHKVNYSVNIETLVGSSVDLNAVRYKLDDQSSNILGSLDNVDSSLYVNLNVLSSKSIYSGSLNSLSSKTFNLKMWIDENATINQSANKVFNSKVAVVGELKPSRAILADGSTLNIRLKSLSDVDDRTYTETFIQKCMDEFYHDCSGFFIDHGIFQNSYAVNHVISYVETGNAGIEGILVSNTPPDKDAEVVVLSSEDSDYEILGWLASTSSIYFNYIYLYAGDNEIYLNPNSDFAFSGFADLKKFDLSMFNLELVESMDYMFAASGANLLDEYADEKSILDIGENTSAPKLKSLDNFLAYSTFDRIENLSSILTSNVNSSASLFEESDVIEIDFSNVNTSNVENMSKMFKKANKIETLDISEFDTSNVSNMNEMFLGMQNVDTIYVGDDWTTSSISEDNANNPLFGQNYALSGGSGNNFYSSWVTKEYARVDCDEEYGYFTYKGPLGDTATYCASLGS